MTQARVFVLCAILALAPGATVPAAQRRMALPASASGGAIDAPLVSGARSTAGSSDALAQTRLARLINASVPLARSGLFPAQPFYLDASLADRSRALDCLAAADFYEAGADPADQRAVAQVVLNRVRHAAFPATICGVIFEGADRPTGCQFTFTCDGSLARRRPSPAAWQQARRVAGEMLLGRVEAVVGQATHYHTDWVSPAWDRTMDKLAVVKTHLFFRWRGTGGAPAAFARRYAGSEPRIARLAGLSPAHSDGNGNPADASWAAAATGAGPETPTLAPAPAPPTLQEQGIFLVALPAGATPDSFRRLAEKSCAGLGDCRFVGWTDPNRRATALPLPGTSVDAISFTFVRRAAERTERAQWNCAEFPRVNTQECLARAS